MMLPIGRHQMATFAPAEKFADIRTFELPAQRAERPRAPAADWPPYVGQTPPAAACRRPGMGGYGGSTEVYESDDGRAHMQLFQTLERCHRELSVNADADADAAADADAGSINVRWDCRDAPPQRAAARPRQPPRRVPRAPPPTATARPSRRPLPAALPRRLPAAVDIESCAERPDQDRQCRSLAKSAEPPRHL